LLIGLLAGSVAFAATPRAYVSLAAVGAGAGYHAWNRASGAPGAAGFDIGVQFLEGTWFLSPRLGLGFRVYEVAGSAAGRDSTRPYLLNATWLPTVSWVLNRDARGFGYLNLAAMPYLHDAASDTAVSALALDYGYVPFAPWPLEGRVRLTASVLDWSSRSAAWQLSAGVRAGLSWWFLLRSPAAQIQ
jgi:hypothetical protein